MKWLTRNVERFIIALLVLALFGGAAIVMSFVNVPAQNRDAVIQLVGGVNLLAGVVVGWYFRGKANGEAPDSE